jgi:hypothetical protein
MTEPEQISTPKTICNYMQDMLAIVVVFGMFFVIYWILTDDAKAKDDHLLSMLIMVLVYEFQAVFRYFYGSMTLFDSVKDFNNKEDK